MDIHWGLIAKYWVFAEGVAKVHPELLEDEQVSFCINRLKVYDSMLLSRLKVLDMEEKDG